MSKGYGKLQVQILDFISYESEDGFAYSTYELIAHTGAQKSSVNRALRGLRNDGMIKTFWLIDEMTTSGLPRRDYRHYLTANKAKHEQFIADREAMRADRLAQLQIRADKAGVTAKELDMQERAQIFANAFGG